MLRIYDRIVIALAFMANAEISTRDEQQTRLGASAAVVDLLLTILEFCDICSSGSGQKVMHDGGIQPLRSLIRDLSPPS